MNGHLARPPRRWATSLSLALLCACTEPATQFLVVVDSDMTVPSDLSGLRTRVLTEGGEVLASVDFELVSDVDPNSRTTFSLPLSFGVLRPDPDARRGLDRVVVQVDALGPTSGPDEPLFVRRAVTRFVDGKSLVLPMYLASQCRATPCADGQTCTERGCLSPIVDETRLQDTTGTDADLNITPGIRQSNVDAGSASDASQVDNGDAGGGSTADAGAASPGAYQWSIRAGGAASDDSRAMTTDIDGNVYVAGYFGGTVDFGGGALMSAGDKDIFVASYTAEGRYRWSKRFGGSDEDEASDVYIARPNGRQLMVTGSFKGVANLGRTVTSQGSGDVFVLSLAKDTGAVEWVHTFGGTGSDTSHAIVRARDGTVHVAGQFEDSIDLGGRAGTLTSAGWWDLFVVTYEGMATTPTRGLAAGSGMFASSDSADTLALDANDNLYVAGRFMETINLGGAPLTSAGSSDIFLASYAPNGTHRWSKSFGAFNTDTVDAIATNSRGEVFMYGVFRDTVNFGGSELTSVPPYDTFMASFNTNGMHRWSTRLGGGNDLLYASELTVDGDDIYLTGAFEETINFGGGPLMSRGDWDIYVTHFTREGTQTWARTFGSADLDYASAISVHGQRLFVAGEFWGPVDFGGGPLMNAGNSDAFVLSLDLGP